MKTIFVRRSEVQKQSEDVAKIQSKIKELPNGAGTWLDLIYGGGRTGQIFGTLVFDIADSPPSEADTVFAALRVLDDWQLHSLRKISMCQIMATKKEEVLPWLLKANGKYYFGGATHED